ncbi:MAG: hypothetical protein GY696_40360 [Gammaproteobacteria bacterium]|nr:hypothetical protein [Gammaproteobacteria bacterium]
MIQALMEKYISRFSYPLVIHSYSGKEFVSKLMEKLLAKLEVAGRHGLEKAVASPRTDI